MSVTLHTTLGDIKIELFCEEAPIAVYNFLALCATDYYNDCLFFRNMKDFMVQTGDPTGTGKGGESIYGKFFQDEFFGKLSHVRGSVSMANRGPNQNGSQFFIAYKALPYLDQKNTIFGKPAAIQDLINYLLRVIHGWDTLTKIERAPVGKKDKPTTDIKITSITVHANPMADDD